MYSSHEVGAAELSLKWISMPPQFPHGLPLVKHKDDTSHPTWRFLPLPSDHGI